MRTFLTVAFALVFVASMGSVAFAGDAGKGEKIFSSKCKTCHSTGTNKILGPGLAGITDRASDEWLHKWILDPQGVWEANEGYTQELKKAVGGENRSRTRMKVRVREKQIDDIIAYLHTL